MIKRKDPEISIIIPVYNAEKTLNECLNSVLNQDYDRYELVVVDNCSTDSTKDIIFNFQKKNPFIKYVFEKKKGRGSARNAGVSESNGEIIVMVDSDCIAPNNWLRNITAPIRDEGENAVQGGELDATGNYWSKNIQLASEKFISESLSKDRKYTTHLDTKNFAIKGQIMRALMFDKAIGNIEDFELALRLRKITKTRFLEDVRVEHYHKSSLRKFFAVQFDRAYWVYQIFQKHKGDEKLKNEIMFSGLSFWNYLVFPFWIIKQFILDPKIGFFLLISNIAWGLGTIYAILKRILNNFSSKND